MSSTRPSLLFITGATVLFALFALAAGALAGAQYAVPIVILGVVVLAFIALNALLSRRTVERHGGDPGAAEADEADGLPSAHLVPDDRPLGDTAQAHDEISPHDLPRDSPGRRAAAPARRRGGTTRGHEEGAAGGGVLQDERRD